MIQEYKQTLKECNKELNQLIKIKGQLNNLNYIGYYSINMAMNNEIVNLQAKINNLQSLIKQNKKA